MKLFRIVAFVSLTSLLFVACSSDSANESRDIRKRRTNESTTTKESTTTIAPTESTLPIKEEPLSKPAQIKQTWTQEELCSKVNGEQAKEILEMTTVPEAQYSFQEPLGARCTYSSGAGDEIYFEYSTMSYKQARDIDNALNAQGTPIVVDGVGGVTKTNKAIGTIYELNISGENSNQWIVNADTDKKAKKLAQYLIAAIK